MHSSGSGFFLSLGAQCSSEAEPGPPRRSLIRATPEPLVLSHNSISEDFFVNRDESTFHPPRGSKSKASLASNPMEGLHQRSLRQGDPSSLVEMIPKVEKRGFRTMEKRNQRFFP